MNHKTIIRVAKNLNKIYRTAELQKPIGQHHPGFICNALKNSAAYEEKEAFQAIFEPENFDGNNNHGYFGRAHLQKNKDARLTALLLFAEMVKHGDV